MSFPVQYSMSDHVGSFYSDVKVHIDTSQPPSRPSTMSGALQLGVPLSAMMDAIARLLVSGIDSEPQVTPVPYLVPLPPGHTLNVKNPGSLDERSFGDLKEENPKFIIKVSFK